MSSGPQGSNFGEVLIKIQNTWGDELTRNEVWIKMGDGLPTTSSVVFFYEKFYIFIQVSVKFVPVGPIDNTSALVQVQGFASHSWQASVIPMEDTILLVIKRDSSHKSHNALDRYLTMHHFYYTFSATKCCIMGMWYLCNGSITLHCYLITGHITMTS